ncbi:MAG: hypothetical protein PHH28_06300 [Desulfuromonadaceae bacterium]|nr:hypothetical protein [Desulfuromonadaceae bacterium]
MGKSTPEEPSLQPDLAKSDYQSGINENSGRTIRKLDLESGMLLVKAMKLQH